MERGFDEQEARGLILSGCVRVDGVRETRVGFAVRLDASIEVSGRRKYPSRAAEKLAGALEAFHPQLEGRICIDLGASHGGFSRVLLDAGVRRVYAVDVAYGILDFGVRSDPRVIPLERKNAREISADWFMADELHSGEKLFIVCDLSFISLKTILSSLCTFARNEGVAFEGIFLLKPQFEASRLTEKGVLREEVIQQQIIDDLGDHAIRLGMTLLGLRPSTVTGTKGNQEFLLYLSFAPEKSKTNDQ